MRQEIEGEGESGGGGDRMWEGEIETHHNWNYTSWIFDLSNLSETDFSRVEGSLEMTVSLSLQYRGKDYIHPTVLKLHFGETPFGCCCYYWIYLIEFARSNMFNTRACFLFCVGSFSWFSYCKFLYFNRGIFWDYYLIIQRASQVMMSPWWRVSVLRAIP